jgi:hypothetical protein
LASSGRLKFPQNSFGSGSSDFIRQQFGIDLIDG